MTRRLPVTLLTGFLGAGKTTLLNAFLRRPEGAGTLVLVNEFGEADIDGATLAATVADGSRLYSLPNGCLCCDLQAGLADTLEDLLESSQFFERPIRRVVIETTGLANPATIIRPFAYDGRIRPLAMRPRTVTLAAADRIRDQLTRFREALAQVAIADELVLTKCDLASEADIVESEAALRRVNPTATLRRAGLTQDAAAALDPLPDSGSSGPPPAWPDSDGLAVHTAGVSTFSVSLKRPLDPDRFRDALSFLILRHADRLLRLKGVVHFAGEAVPRLINVVHDVHDSIALPGAALTDAGSLVFIGMDLPEQMIRADLARCQV